MKIEGALLLKYTYHICKELCPNRFSRNHPCFCLSLLSYSISSKVPFHRSFNLALGVLASFSCHNCRPKCVSENKIKRMMSNIKWIWFPENVKLLCFPLMENCKTSENSGIPLHGRPCTAATFVCPGEQLICFL